MHLLLAPPFWFNPHPVGYRWALLCELDGHRPLCGSLPEPEPLCALETVLPSRFPTGHQHGELVLLPSILPPTHVPVPPQPLRHQDSLGVSLIPCPSSHPLLDISSATAQYTPPSHSPEGPQASSLLQFGNKILLSWTLALTSFRACDGFPLPQGYSPHPLAGQAVIPSRSTLTARPSLCPVLGRNRENQQESLASGSLTSNEEDAQ